MRVRYVCGCLSAICDGAGTWDSAENSRNRVYCSGTVGELPESLDASEWCC